MRAFLICMIAAVIAGPALAEEISLFNGKDLTGWSIYVDERALAVDPNLKPNDVFRITPEGYLLSAGSPSGLISTVKDYKDFRITLEYRWVQKGPEGKELDYVFPEQVRGNRDSGMNIRNISGSNGQGCDAYEIQIQNMPERGRTTTGGIYVVGYAYYDKSLKTDPALMVPKQLGTAPRFERDRMRLPSKNVEKPLGEWNLLDVLVDRDHIVVKLNGEQINEATGAEQVAGKIAFQSESWPIEFRNINLTPINP